MYALQQPAAETRSKTAADFIIFPFSRSCYREEAGEDGRSLQMAKSDQRIQDVAAAIVDCWCPF
jgi:hypothetical protein